MVALRCSTQWVSSLSYAYCKTSVALGHEVGLGSDSENLAASKTSPLVIKQPTQALTPPEVRVGPEADA
jgi:hypothetical protein